MSILHQVLIFVILTWALFVIGKNTIQIIYDFLKHIFKHDSIVFSCLAFIFLPGTVFHELAHYIMAHILFLHVTGFSLIPQWCKGNIILGKVTYIRKDVFRSILVGVAPILFGMASFITIAYLQLFPDVTNGFIHNALFVYLIFVISTSMYSSKQDLMDIVYIIPIVLTLVVLIYIFNSDLQLLVQNAYFQDLSHYLLNTLNIYLTIAIILHLSVIAIYKIMILLIIR